MINSDVFNQSVYQPSRIQADDAASGHAVCQSVAQLPHQEESTPGIDPLKRKALKSRNVAPWQKQLKEPRSGVVDPELKAILLKLAEEGTGLDVANQLEKHGLTIRTSPELSKTPPEEKQPLSGMIDENEFLQFINKRRSLRGTMFLPGFHFYAGVISREIIYAALPKLYADFKEFLSVVPDELRTEHFFQAFLCQIKKESAKKSKLLIEMSTLPPLSVFPEALIDSAVANLFVCHRGCNLEYVPDHLKTRELCLQACESEQSNIQYVPEDILTDEFLHNVGSIDLCNLKHIPEKRITERLLKTIRSDVKRQLIEAIQQTDFSVCSGTDVFETLLNCNEDFLCYLPNTVLQRFPERLLAYIERKCQYIEFHNVPFPDPQQALETLISANNEYYKQIYDYKNDPRVKVETLYARCFRYYAAVPFELGKIPVDCQNHRLCLAIMDRFQHQRLPLETVPLLVRFTDGTHFVREKLDECAMDGYLELIHLLASQHIPINEKKDLIDRFDQCDLFSSHTQPTQYQHLYSDEDPSVFLMKNPYLNGLKQTVCGNQFDFPLNPVSDEIQQYLAGSTSLFFFRTNRGR